ASGVRRGRRRGASRKPLACDHRGRDGRRVRRHCIRSIPLLLAGVVIFAGGIGGWIHQDLQRPSSPFYGLAAAVESRFPRVSARKLGMWLMLATEIMFFSAIIGASLIGRAHV